MGDALRAAEARAADAVAAAASATAQRDALTRNISVLFRVRTRVWRDDGARAGAARPVSLCAHHLMRVC
jgi:hypothetical protein